MSICVGCAERLQENTYLKCHTCNSTYCFVCLNFDQEKKTNPTLLASLKCPSCMNINTRRGQRNSSRTSTLILHAGQFDQPPQSPPPPPCTADNKQDSKPVGSAPVTLENISALLDAKLNSSMNSLRAALKKDVMVMISTEISTAVQGLKEDFTVTTDYIMAGQSDFEIKLQEKDKIIRTLEIEQSAMRADLNNLNKRFDTMEKISRDHNLELQEIPESRNENVLTIFKNICHALDTPILDTEIRACRRVAKLNAASSRPRNIIVNLTSPRLRDNILSAVHRFNKQNPNGTINTSHAGLSGECRKIYIREHLSFDCKQLYTAARKFAKENNYKFVWTKYGQIYMRKDENANAIRVKDSMFLNNFKEN